MAEEAEAVTPTCRPRRMPEDCGRGRGGRGRGEGGDRAPSEQTQGDASTSHAHEAGTSKQTEAFLAGLDSPGFQDLMDQILLFGEGYKPEFYSTQFDGTQSEPVFGLSQSFMVLDSNRPSADVSGHS
ncbi:hypothetical protein PIB30_050924 [Stylosanthes scabra]|uniref:Uncharacterized protein n=1 Tax=Stylosanthes scabra TaxID=79078 RepID=A0ABU6QI05_9FABA|nr:hypothetical protein [Stylosanthes scabra]